MCGTWACSEIIVLAILSLVKNYNFLWGIRGNRKEILVVILQEKTYIYDINSLDILDTIDTVPNFKGLCAFSPSLDGCFLALPASTTKGSVLVYNVMERHSHCEIDAHRSPLAAMVLSSSGMYIATASEQGTIIRVHLVSDATKSYSFRRGTYPSTIFSLSFGPSMQLPDILVATSSSGSVHAFPLGFALNQRSRRPSSFLGSIIPESVNDASAHHHVLHNASPARVKSYAVIRKVDKVAESSMSESAAYRAIISLITYSGYFLEYSLSINHQNESSWILEREFNLLTVISERVNS
ncbi:autophagy-related protein 18b-like [Camellia sinensis]|uniref:autophagy-related protein 18b-like n=1 Tax=Camellia sinensis TaxID=4442 RepID=UPI0010359086|nr:autophagy-related protein 18b-like [Camellia sinensis]